MPALYIDREGYRARTGDKSVATDGNLDAQIEMACRTVDRELGVAPGMFGPSSATFRFNANGGTRLWLRDTSDDQYYLRTITADSLTIDSDGDGSFDDYTWDFADAWIRGGPENAVTFGEAFTSIELLSRLSTAPIATWPSAVNCIQIAGTWGYAVTPGAIIELVVDMVHTVRQSGLAGGTGFPTIEGDLPLSTSMLPTLRRLKAHYSQRLAV